MTGLTLHTATNGFHTPLDNSGSNPLAQASRHFHLGPDLGIFSLQLVTDPGRLSRDILFVGDNPLSVSIDNGSLAIVHGTSGSDKMSPHDLRLLIGGVSFQIPYSTAKKIRAKNGGRIFWKTSTGQSGKFYLFRSAPPIFR